MNNISPQKENVCEAELKKLRDWASQFGKLALKNAEIEGIGEIIISAIEKERKNSMIVMESMEKLVVQERLEMARVKKELNEEIVQLNATVNNLREDVVDAENKGEMKQDNIKQELKDFKMNYSKEREIRLKCESNNESKIQEITILKERIKVIEDREQKEKRVLIQQLNTMRDQKNEMEENMYQNNVSIEQERQKVNEQRQREQKEREDMIGRISDTQRVLDNIILEKNNQNIQIQQLQNNIKQFQDKNEALRRQLEQEKDKVANAIQDTRDRMASDIDDIKQQVLAVEKQKEALKKEYEQRLFREKEKAIKELEDIRSLHNKELMNGRIGLEGRLERMASEQKDEIDRLMQKNKNITQEKEKLEKEWQDKERNIKSQLAELLHSSETEIFNLKSLRESQQRILEERERELELKEKNWIEERTQIEKNEKNRVRDIENKWEDERRKRENQMKEEQDQIYKKHEKERKQLAEQLEKSEREKRDKIQFYENQISNVKKSCDEKMLAEIESIKRNQENEIKSLKFYYENTYKPSGSIDLSKHQQEIDKLSEKFDDEIRKVHLEYGEKIKKMRNDQQQRMDELREESEREQIELLKSKDELRTLKKQIDNLKQEYSEHDRDIKNLNNKLEEKQAQCSHLQKELQKAIEEKQMYIADRENQLSQQDKIFQKKIDEFRLDYEKKINDGIQEQLEFTEQLKKDQDQLVISHEQRIEELLNQIYELQRILSERPSRQEDIKRINALNRQLNSQAQEHKQYAFKLCQANEIVKYLQLELENYKSNYDMFGPLRKGIEVSYEQIIQDSSLLNSPKKAQNIPNNGKLSVVSNSLQSQIHQSFQTNKIVLQQQSQPAQQSVEKSFSTDKKRNKQIMQSKDNLNEKIILPDQNQSSDSYLNSSLSQINRQSQEIKNLRDSISLNENHDIVPHPLSFIDSTNRPTSRTSRKYPQNSKNNLKILPWEQQLQISLQQQQMQKKREKMQSLKRNNNSFSKKSRAESLHSQNNLYANAESFLDVLKLPLLSPKISKDNYHLDMEDQQNYPKRENKIINQQEVNYLLQQREQRQSKQKSPLKRDPQNSNQDLFLKNIILNERYDGDMISLQKSMGMYSPELVRNFNGSSLQNEDNLKQSSISPTKNKKEQTPLILKKSDERVQEEQSIDSKRQIGQHPLQNKIEGPVWQVNGNLKWKKRNQSQSLAQSNQYQDIQIGKSEIISNEQKQLKDNSLKLPNLNQIRHSSLLSMEKE